MMCPLASLVNLIPAPDLVNFHTEILIGPRRAGRFLVASSADTAPLFSIRCAIAASERCGDGPHQYHPKYFMALLGSIAANRVEPNVTIEPENAGAFVVPEIQFETEEWTRRSMTLNAMRMSREFLEVDSPRVLQLVESRLQAGQRDVVHDVLVYLINQINQMRDTAYQARVLRAESLAAYLGLEVPAVLSLFTSPRLHAVRISTTIESGRAGSVRRAISVVDVVSSQLTLLRPELNAMAAEERRVWKLIDLIVPHLYQLVK